MSNPFAILADYRKEGPAVPEREKIVRQKDRHESGTGRRDKTKREGRGMSNWGQPGDEAKPATKREQRVAKEEADAAAEPVEEQEEAKPQFVAASQFFDNDEDEEVVGVPQKATKADKAVDNKYLQIMTLEAKKHAVVKEEQEEDENVLETQFLTTEQARAQRAAQQNKGHPQKRDFHGPRRNTDRKPRQERPERKEGEAPKAEGEAPQRKFARTPRNQGEAPKGERPQRQQRRDDAKKPRDQRPGNVQHQRNAAQNKVGRLDISNFPSL
ncbi:hypothetical protein TVAG_003950 [Trichomonas vaginalis G3]|uniref:Hyaluronan/mRNA-binding protein domain-containing protein n=1 Tax=Trichomonas vaginalis (strain ATCC PRA-98 / G3) TaxID=412133 RepID=A2E5A9_TRIV3|nr:hyaluronic acid-binding protein 4 family [Trichomonas vaginalis G3]EAY12189.1 hypothetical protein TVAG_003950 [Trichomonas vaginalis G3]KAI5515424.1 hyaluronic acid-binding protein 4 family [Trichomonas vaginalis G3]|eukprot:XP_001324412.1 hypothetical protein [Trichomonas vaginalis G3]